MTVDGFFREPTTVEKWPDDCGDDIGNSVTRCQFPVFLGAFEYYKKWAHQTAMKLGMQLGEFGISRCGLSCLD